MEGRGSGKGWGRGHLALKGKPSNPAKLKKRANQESPNGKLKLLRKSGGQVETKRKVRAPNDVCEKVWEETG